ncbi:MAG: FecR domain-containing protein [Bacteroidales bacterium]
MKKKINKKTFAKYYWGIANEQERREIHDSDESDEMLREQWENYNELKLVSTPPNHDKITQKINERISAKAEEKKRSFVFRTFIMKYAAAGLITLIASAVLVYFLIYTPGSIDQMAMIEKENPRGQRSELLLPDGSKVWLNAESKITFPKEFTQENRIVILQGEAYFDVIKSEQPFIVKTNSIDIEVLGTGFNVLAYPCDETITTTLVNGRVSVKRIDTDNEKVQKAILTPNHQAVYYKNEDRFVLDQVDVLKFTSWKQGKLIFDNVPIIDLVNSLERWYNVDFLIQDNLSYKYNYTLTITDESITEVMNLIQKTTPNINISINGGVIEISEN